MVMGEAWTHPVQASAHSAGCQLRCLDLSRQAVAVPSPSASAQPEVQPLTQQVTADMTGHALTPQHDTDLGHHGVQIERRELAR